jgi:hypothetical protein
VGPSFDALEAADSTAKIEARKVFQNRGNVQVTKSFALHPFIGTKFLDMDPTNYSSCHLQGTNGVRLLARRIGFLTIDFSSITFLLAMIKDEDFEASSLTVLVPAFGASTTAWPSSFPQTFIDAVQPQVRNSDHEYCDERRRQLVRLSGKDSQRTGTDQSNH